MMIDVSDACWCQSVPVEVKFTDARRESESSNKNFYVTKMEISKARKEESEEEAYLLTNRSLVMSKRHENIECVMLTFLNISTKRSSQHEGMILFNLYKQIVLNKITSFVSGNRCWVYIFHLK
jgi:hypothetical protein